MAVDFTISGIQAGQTTDDNEVLQPFADVAVTGPGGGTATATVTLSDTANGSLTSVGSPASFTSFSVTGTFPEIQQALQDLVFTPTAGEVPVGQAVTTGFALTVTDGSGTASDATTSVTAASVGSAPAVSYTMQAGAPTNLGSPLPYFAAAGATISDVDPNASVSTVITLDVDGAASDANGSLSGAGLTKTGVGTYSLAAASAAAETQALQGLVFTPAAPGSHSVTTVALQVSDASGATGLSSSTLDLVRNLGGDTEITNSDTHSTTFDDTANTVQNHTYSTRIEAVLDQNQVVYDQTFDRPYNDPEVQNAVQQADQALASYGAAPGSPALTASSDTNLGQQTSDDQSIKKVSDPTSGLSTITSFGPTYVGPGENNAADADHGYFYVLSGQNAINVNTQTDFTYDRTLTTTTSDLLSQTYTISGSNGAAPASTPTITGTHGTSDTAEATVTPFADVTVGDANPGATDGLTIVLTGGGGTLADPGGALTRNPDGSYALAATDPATLSGELDRLQFTPANGTPGATATTTFGLTVASSAGTTATDDGTSVDDTAAPTPTPTPSPTRGDAVTIAPQVSYKDGVFTLTGTASSPAPVTSVEISAVLNEGAREDLGAATVNGDGTFTFQDRIGANLQGFVQATETDAAGGQATSADPLFSLQGGLGPHGGAAGQTRYTQGGMRETAITRFGPLGSEHVDVRGYGQTFTSAYADTFDDNKKPATTFVFDPGFSLDVVDESKIGGGGHDTLSFLGSDFGRTPQAQLGRLLAHSYDSGGNLFIIDPTTKDAVQLDGISKSQLVRNERDIVFR